MEINSLGYYSFFFGIGVLILGWGLSVKYPSLPGWFSNVVIISGVGLIIYGTVPLMPQWLWKPKFYPLAFVVIGVGFIIIGSIWAYDQKSKEQVVSDLVFEPKQHDSFLQFDKAFISISEAHPNPFLLQIQNIGKADIVNARIKFEVVGLNLQELLSDSPAFPITKPNQEGGIWITTEKRKNGKDSRYSSVDFTTTGERVVRLLSARGKPEEIDMPEPVKKAMSLFMIASSYGLQSLVYDKIKEKIVSTDADDKDGWAEIQATQWDGIAVEMPDIAMHVSWLGSNQRVVTQTVILKSIYLSYGGGDWVTDSTSGESFRSIQMGRLSFENRNEPEQGSYNYWKNRTLKAAKK